MKQLRKLMQVVLALSMITVFNSCGSTPKESFWEGDVKPGTYTGAYSHESAGGTNRSVITLTIYEDQTVKYKEEETILWGDRHTSIEVARGYITKYTENYDGERKIWYGIEAKPEPGARYHQSLNLSTELELGGGNPTTYQEYGYRRGDMCKLHLK